MKPLLPRPQTWTRRMPLSMAVRAEHDEGEAAVELAAHEHGHVDRAAALDEHRLHIQAKFVEEATFPGPRPCPGENRWYNT